tara:strand:- start:3491 stop:4612 length:1122 start_codon:yes stop_codon:yes gene_type:complete
MINVIDKKFKQLLSNNIIEFDQKQDDLVRLMSSKQDELYQFSKKSNLVSMLGGKKKDFPKGLYIHGDVGRGKSMLMDLFFANINIKEKKRVHFNQFMNETHDKIFKWRKKNKEGKNKDNSSDPLLMVAKSVQRQCKVLCFDEFQVEDIADAMILGRLFKIIFEMNILIIATSNIHPNNLYSEGLNRETFIPFIDMLHENMDVFHLNASKDYRIDKFRNKIIYFYPINKTNEKNCNDAWQSLKGSIEVKCKVLNVKGRNVIINNSAGKFVKFSYDELCVKPMGVADFLEIEKNFDVIFIMGIPIIDGKKRNEIKRFINLIDILYEARKIIFVLADAEPKKLLQDGKDFHIFQRTVSRLEEMQSAEYFSNFLGYR